jgi:Holliday junction resolvase
MGKMSRDKGKAGEREVAALLRAYGFAGQRGVQYQGGKDSADVLGLPGWHIEVKRVEAFNLYTAMAQAVEDTAGVNTPVVFHRKNGKEWVAVLKAEDFLKLVRGF